MVHSSDARLHEAHTKSRGGHKDENDNRSTVGPLQDLHISVLIFSVRE